MLAANVSSDSPRLKLRSPGPISSPAGAKPAMCQSAGSREVLVKLPPRISEIAGLNAEAPPAARRRGAGSGAAAGAAASAAASAAAGSRSRVAGCASRAHRRARRIRSSTPAVRHAAPRHRQRPDAIAGNVASANSAATGLETPHGYSPSENQQTRGRESAGVRINGFFRRSGGARERKAGEGARAARPGRIRCRRRGRGQTVDRRERRVAPPPTMFCRGADEGTGRRAASRGAVRIGLQVRAGVHDHAELGATTAPATAMHEPAAITSNQNGLRTDEYPPQAAPPQTT